MPRREQATLTDVARVAMVSPSAVSRVVSRRMGNVGLSAETRTRIRSAIEKLDYRPNVAARSLRRRQSDTVIVLSSFQNQPLMVALDSALKSAGLHCLAWLLQPGEPVMPQLMDALAGHRADGVVLVGSCVGVSDLECAQLRLQGDPVISIGRPFSAETGIASFVFDWDDVLRRIVEALRERGHERILLLTEPGEKPTTRLYVDTARRVFREAGMPLPDSHIRGRAEQDGSAAQTVTEALDQGLSFTAVVVFDMLFEVLWALSRRRVRVPQDVSVVCVDERATEIGGDLSLTHVEWPLEKMAREAVAGLVAARSDGPGTPDLCRRYSGRIVAGRTLDQAPRGGPARGGYGGAQHAAAPPSVPAEQRRKGGQHRHTSERLSG